MKRWFVITPQFEYIQTISWEMGGPADQTCDVIEIEASTKRDAIKFGVREMLRLKNFEYCRAQRLDDACPYTGVWAEPVGFNG